MLLSLSAKECILSPVFRADGITLWIMSITVSSLGSDTTFSGVTESLRKLSISLKFDLVLSDLSEGTLLWPLTGDLDLGL